MSLKWSCGVPNEKSPVRWTQKPAAPAAETTPPPAETMYTVAAAVPPPMEDNVCLKTINKDSCSEIVKPRMREELYHRLSSRESIIQTSRNPFLHNSYITDIENQEKFLRGK